MTEDRRPDAIVGDFWIYERDELIEISFRGNTSRVVGLQKDNVDGEAKLVVYLDSQPFDDPPEWSLKDGEGAKVRAAADETSYGKIALVCADLTKDDRDKDGRDFRRPKIPRPPLPPPTNMTTLINIVISKGTPALIEP